jgi:hypothetical protein
MVNIQRLLDEGLFTASYKFALLLALADLSIEYGDDSGKALELATDAIAEKFVLTYWRQAMPYPNASEEAILQQNTDRQAAIVNFVGARKETEPPTRETVPAAAKCSVGAGRRRFRLDLSRTVARRDVRAAELERDVRRNQRCRD